MMCSRIMIMLGGRIRLRHAGGEWQKLVAASGQIVAEIAAAGELKAMLGRWPKWSITMFPRRKGEFQRCALTARDGFEFWCPQIFALVQKRAGFARTDAQPALLGRHLCAGDPTERGGRELMQVFLTLMRRELATYFSPLTGYVIIAAVALLCGLSFWVLINGMGRRVSTARHEMFFSAANCSGSSCSSPTWSSPCAFTRTRNMPVR